MEEVPLKETNEPGEDRSHIYMGVVLGLVILVMGYLALFTNDPWKIFHHQPETTALAGATNALSETSAMNDEEVHKSLVQFIESFYFDQRRGYFDPPSYFAPITETFYNYHNLTYQKLKELYWRRRQDMENLKYNWIPSSLQFRRDSSMIIATYWISEAYYRPSKHAQQSADVRNELVIDENGKIVSMKELEVRNFESYSFTDTAAAGNDSLKVQDEALPSDVAVPEVSAEAGDQKIYDLGAVDDFPEFPGGMAELAKTMSRNLRYPAAAKQNGTEGKVFTGFTIEKNGSVTDAKVLRGIGSGCDEEALRVIRALPAWKPARVNGKAVRNAYVLSVTFKLGE